MYEGQFSLVDVYVNDIWVGIGSLFQTWDGPVTGTMALNTEKIRESNTDIPMLPLHPYMLDSLFSFVDKLSEKSVGYFHYDSGTIEIVNNNIYVTRAVFRKSLLDVTPRIPEVKYIGMGYE